MTQMKQQNKTPERELNKMEISNLPEAEFKVNFKWKDKEVININLPLLLQLFELHGQKWFQNAKYRNWIITKP